MCLNVRRFPPPSSRTYQLHYIGAETREEGGTRCQRALAAEWDRGAEKIGQQQVAETASGCPKRWCWSKRRTGGTEDSLRAPGSRRGGCRPRGSGGVAPFAWRPKPAAIRHVGEEQGTGDSLPAAPRPEEPPPSPGGGWASGRPPKRSSTIAWHASEPPQLVEDRAGSVSGNRTEIFFFPLSPLSSLSLLILRLLSLASSVLTPRYAAAALTGSPRERGEGGVERSLVSTPRPAGAMGVCDEWGGAESRGNGARPVEWMIMNDTCATHRSRVPRRSSGRNKRRSDDHWKTREAQAWILVCVLFAAVVREGLPLFCYVCLLDD